MECEREKLMTHTKRKLLAAIVASSFLVATPMQTAASTCEPESSTMLPVSSAGRPIEFYGRDIGHAEIQALWQVTTSTTKSHIPLGRVIAAGQDWFGECKFPGLGIANGSGYDLNTRNVWLWVWADAVDLEQARASIVNYIYSLLPPPETTTTTAPTTTVPDETATTTSTPLAEEPAVEPAVYAEPLQTLYAAQTLVVPTTLTSYLVAPLSATAARTIVAAEKKKKKKKKKVSRVRKADPAVNNKTHRK